MKTSAVLLALCLFYLSAPVVSGFFFPPPCCHKIKPLESRISATEHVLRQMKQEIRANRVAFGASIGNVGNVGIYNTEITLTYKTVFLNTGAFNQNTGIFTAPVKGAYYFSFSGHSYPSKPMGLHLMLNGVRIVSAFNPPAGKRYETATNGMILQLKVGDKVYLSLQKKTWIHCDKNNHSTFVGHLLFPL